MFLLVLTSLNWHYSATWDTLCANRQHDHWPTNLVTFTRRSPWIEFSPKCCSRLLDCTLPGWCLLYPLESIFMELVHIIYQWSWNSLDGNIQHKIHKFNCISWNYQFWYMVHDHNLFLKTSWPVGFSAARAELVPWVHSRDTASDRVPACQVLTWIWWIWAWGNVRTSRISYVPNVISTIICFEGSSTSSLVWCVFLMVDELSLFWYVF